MFSACVKTSFHLCGGPSINGLRLIVKEVFILATRALPHQGMEGRVYLQLSDWFVTIQVSVILIAVLARVPLAGISRTHVCSFFAERHFLDCLGWIPL